MELSLLMSLLISLSVLLHYSLSYQVVTNPDSRTVIGEYKDRLKTELGRPILTPQIQQIAIEPATIKKCLVTGGESCYNPVYSQSTEKCYTCDRTCEKYNITEFEKYDFITTEYDGGKRWASIKNCVNLISIPGVGSALKGNKSSCVSGNKSQMIVNKHNLVFPNSTLDVNPYTKGTLTFRLHLNKQQIFRGRNVNLHLQCNSDKSNMNLVMGDNDEDIILRDVLNDDEGHTVDNSIFIAHTSLPQYGETYTAIYVNDRLVASGAFRETSPDPDYFLDTPPLSGVIYDFYVYKEPLNQRQITELYRKSSVEVRDDPACYCPLNHPLFVNTSSLLPGQPWLGSNCSAIFPLTHRTSAEEMSVALKNDTVKRIQKVSFSYENLLSLSSDEPWISGQGQEAKLNISFKLFYNLKALAIRMDTLPREMVISAQQDIVVYNTSCPDLGPDVTESVMPRCYSWEDVKLHNNLLLLNLTGINQKLLRSDRLDLKYNGHQNKQTVYVVNSIQVFADCGCIEGRGECIITNAQTGFYECKCHPGYKDTYCHDCSDGYYDSEGIACLPCKCNSEGSTSSVCDKATGQCSCHHWLTTKTRTCGPYIKSDQTLNGPKAGGTELKFSGQLLHQINGINIGENICNLDRQVSSNASLLCTTTENKNSTTYNQPIEIQFSIAGEKEEVLTYDSGVTFEYHQNPNITSVDRFSMIESGGLQMVFHGSNLQGVTKPKILFQLPCKSQPTESPSMLYKDCRYDADYSIYSCDMPSLLELANTTSSFCSSKRTRRATDVKKVQPDFDIWPGLKLDGFYAYKNLSSVSSLNISGPLPVYPDPIFDMFTEPQGIREFKMHLDYYLRPNMISTTGHGKKSPAEIAGVLASTDPGGWIEGDAGPILILTGKNLNLSATVSDYRVIIGVARDKCMKMTLTSTELTCHLDKVLSSPSDEVTAPVFKGQPVPAVQVSLGYNLDYTLGYIYFDQPSIVSTELIVGIIIAILVVITGVTAALLCYRKKQMKLRRQIERAALDDFDMLPYPNGNTLQMKVEAILLAEGINDVLLAHLIPATYITQDSVIGQGHFGQVYKGKLIIPEIGVNKVVAIKALKALGLAPIDVVNFIKEALLMKDFSHVNVLPLLGIVYNPHDIESLPLVVTPYMVKGDLKSLISDSEYEFSAGDLLHFGLQVSSGMTYLSRLKFIHRDLRTANCFVDATYIVKIGDFGLSHDISETQYYRAQDKTKPLPVKWMALEVLTADRYTIKSDVWSFGVLLWELMTRGYQPYADVPNSHIKNYLMNGHRLPKPEFIPEPVYDIMQSCWRIDVDMRPDFLELTHVISALLRQADASSTGYQRDYTSNITDLDYTNQDTTSQLASLDEWSAIIPLIKGHGEDYADTGRIGDDEHSSDTSSVQGTDDQTENRPSEPNIFIESTTTDYDTDYGLASPPIHSRARSLTKELERMQSVGKSPNNDYGPLLTAQDAERLYAADDTLLYRPALRAMLSSGSYDGITSESRYGNMFRFRNPPLPALTPSTSQSNPSDSTGADSDSSNYVRRNSSSASGHVGDRKSVVKSSSSPVPEREQMELPHRPQLSLKIPICKNNSNQSNDSVIYEEACAVMPEARSETKDKSNEAASENKDARLNDEAGEERNQQELPPSSPVSPLIISKLSSLPESTSSPPISPPVFSNTPITPPTSLPTSPTTKANMMADGYLVFTTDDLDTDSSITSPKEIREPVSKKESKDLKASKAKISKGLSITSVVPKSPGTLGRPTLSRNFSQDVIGSNFSMPRQFSKQSSEDSTSSLTSGGKSIKLSTKVPVKSTKSSISSMGELSSFDESSPPVDRKTLTSVLENSTPINATSSFTTDGYLEFDALPSDDAKQQSTKAETPKPTCKVADEAPYADILGVKGEVKGNENPATIHKAENDIIEASVAASDEGSAELSTNSHGGYTNNAKHEEKPVARIRPMARNNVNIGVIVPPSRSDDDNSSCYVNHGAIFIQEGDDGNHESDYQNLESVIQVPKGKEPSVDKRTKANKIPVPALRRSIGDALDSHQRSNSLSVDMPERSSHSEDTSATPAMGPSPVLRRNVNNRYREVANMYEETEPPARKSQAVSPNTRRRKLQEALNAQVPTVAQHGLAPNHYQNILAEDESDYDSALAVIGDRRSKGGRDLESFYENVQVQPNKPKI